MFTTLRQLCFNNSALASLQLPRSQQQTEEAKDSTLSPELIGEAQTVATSSESAYSISTLGRHPIPPALLEEIELIKPYIMLNRKRTVSMANQRSTKDVSKNRETGGLRHRASLTAPAIRKRIPARPSTTRTTCRCRCNSRSKDSPYGSILPEYLLDKEKGHGDIDTYVKGGDDMMIEDTLGQEVYQRYATEVSSNGMSQYEQISELTNSWEQDLSDLAALKDQQGENNYESDEIEVQPKSSMEESWWMGRFDTISQLSDASFTNTTWLGKDCIIL